jgi:hypothetical protein
MKKLKELKKIQEIFVNSITDLDSMLSLQLHKIKEEYNDNIIDMKVTLLESICLGEGLDFNKMKDKYLKNKEIKKVVTTEITCSSESSEDVLDKVTINGNDYYYQPKEKGNVYNNNSDHVGVFKNGSISLFK